MTEKSPEEEELDRAIEEKRPEAEIRRLFERWSTSGSSEDSE